MFLQMYSAVPFGGEMCVPVAVMSSHVAEHSRSATICLLAPEDVPVTFRSTSARMVSLTSDLESGSWAYNARP